MTQAWDKQLYSSRYQVARAYRNAARNVAQATTIKVVMDAIDYDPFNIVDLINGYIVPKKAGYYLVSGQLYYASLPDVDVVRGSFYQNGALVVFFGAGGVGGATSNAAVAGNMILYCNGVSDTIELWASHSFAGTLALVTGSAAYTYLFAVGPF